MTRERRKATGLTMEKSQKLANQISLLASFAMDFDLEYLNAAVLAMIVSIGNYEAIGIVDGHLYFKKLADMKARLERLEAIRDFVKVSHKTMKDIIGEGAPKS